VFTSLCVLAAALTGATAGWPEQPKRRRRGALAAAALAASVLLAVGSTLRAHTEPRVLERSAAHFALTRAGWEATPRARQFASTGRRVQRRARAVGATVAILPVLGVATREIDRDLVLIDPYALADPLLARMPPLDPQGFKPGHAEREVPPGYLEARASGDTSGMDPALAEYYEHLRLVVAAPLFDAARWRSIVGFHLGEYDSLLARYRDHRLASAR
jgi:hypothetical protein